MTKKSKLRGLCLAALCAAACDAGTRPTAASSVEPARPAAAPASHNAQAPVVLRVRGPAEVRPHSSVSLEIEIERRLVNENPLSLSVRLPSGAALTGGRAEELIVEGRSPLLTRSLAVSFGDIPAGDLIVHVDTRGPNYGARAAAAYRFGRPEPKLVQPHDRAVSLPGVPGAPIPLGDR